MFIKDHLPFGSEHVLLMIAQHMTATTHPKPELRIKKFTEKMFLD